MRDFVVHSIPGSPFGRAVPMVMEEKGLSLPLRARHAGRAPASPARHKHPFGRIPVLDHGDLLAPQIDFFVGIPEWETLAGPHSKLQSWITRMNERPSMKATTWPQVNAMAQAA